MTVSDPRFLTMEELEAGLEHIRRSPKKDGRLLMIVRRPAIDQREILSQGELDVEVGLVGDHWRSQGVYYDAGRPTNTDRQLTIMNARVIALIAQDESRWPLAGDQLYVDLDLSLVNLPPGTRLAVGSAVVEVTAAVHNGCGKFSARFGSDALRFVNRRQGRALNLRGINTRVVQSGPIAVRHAVRKL
jgi:MOSC domain-containing protein YiiM